jgi:hypothetical protein
LYFNNAELAGKDPATLRIAKTSAASVALANSSNTVYAIPTITTFGSDVTVFSASFTGFSRFFLTEASATLPVTLTDFKGILTTDNNTQLNWSTSSEVNSKQFEVEVSRNGTNYVSIAAVASQGNPLAGRDYQYIHVKPEEGINWYRLKQLDIDGKVQYSKVITVNVSRAKGKPFIFPVPSKDLITINFGAMKQVTGIEILSSDLKSLRRERVIAGAVSTDINLNGLTAGTYFVRILGVKNEMLRFIKIQ